MTGTAELQREIEALRDRSSRLSAAILRISASLDPNTVLHEVVESARELTGARYGAITTTDDAGQVQEFVTSGFTSEQHRHIAAWSDGPRLFTHLRDAPGPLRLKDFPAYARSLGFSADLLPKNLQGTPMRHRGVHVGYFFLAEKEGDRDFTSDDEEILRLFASQAATAIANARTHRDEQRVGPTWRSWSRPRRSAWRSSMPGPAIRCRSIGRRDGSPTGCARRAAPPRSC